MRLKINFRVANLSRIIEQAMRIDRLDSVLACRPVELRCSVKSPIKGEGKFSTLTKLATRKGSVWRFLFVNCLL
jgi:hypothetical protein